MNRVFDPRLIARQTYEDFNKLTKEQLAGKIIHHEIKIKGVDFLVWSEYDEQGDLLQRVMIRAREVAEAEAAWHADPMNQPIKRT